jgi:GTP-binding protein EngB required for normal cell division
VTKVDKLSKNKIAQSLRQTAEAITIPREEIVPFSAHTGEGKKQLWQKIVRILNIATL